MKTHYSLMAIGMVGLTCFGCTTGPGAPKGEDAVRTDTPHRMRRVIEQPASIEPFEETPLVAHISGYVDKIHVDMGSRVKTGEVLAELAIPEMLRELEQKTAMVAIARADVDQAAATLEAADAQVLSAKALAREAEASRGRAQATCDYWKGQYLRFEELVKDRVVEKQNRDEALKQFKASEAYCQEVEAKIQSAHALAKESEAKRSKAKADLAAARARVPSAVAEEGRLKALTEYRFIRAPFDGVVTRRKIHTGHFLQPGPNVLFVVAQTDKLRIVADIPEADAKHISDGGAAKIVIPVAKDLSFDARVARTSSTLEAKARTLQIEFDHLNKDGKLRPGMFANVTFTIDLGERYTLPTSAIFTHNDQPACWRVVDGKAVRTPVKIGGRDGQRVEVLQMQKGSTWEAVTGREEVVVTNLSAVSDDKEVRIERK